MHTLTLNYPRRPRVKWGCPEPYEVMPEFPPIVKVLKSPSTHTIIPRYADTLGCDSRVCPVTVSGRPPVSRVRISGPEIPCGFRPVSRDQT